MAALEEELKTSKQQGAHLELYLSEAECDLKRCKAEVVARQRKTRVLEEEVLTLRQQGERLESEEKFVATLKRRGQSLEAELEQCKKEVQARQHMLDSLRESLASREHTVESLRENVGAQAADFVRKSAAATAKIEELEQVGIRPLTSAYVLYVSIR